MEHHRIDRPQHPCPLQTSDSSTVKCQELETTLLLKLLNQNVRSSCELCAARRRRRGAQFLTTHHPPLRDQIKSRIDFLKAVWFLRLFCYLQLSELSFLSPSFFVIWWRKYEPICKSNIFRCSKNVELHLMQQHYSKLCFDTFVKKGIYCPWLIDSVHFTSWDHQQPLEQHPHAVPICEEGKPNGQKWLQNAPFAGSAINEYFAIRVEQSEKMMSTFGSN